MMMATEQGETRTNYEVKICPLNRRIGEIGLLQSNMVSVYFGMKKDYRANSRESTGHRKNH